MRSIVADCVGLFFLDTKKTKNCWGIVNSPVMMIMQCTSIIRTTKSQQGYDHC